MTPSGHSGESGNPFFAADVVPMNAERLLTHLSRIADACYSPCSPKPSAISSQCA